MLWDLNDAGRGLHRRYRIVEVKDDGTQQFVKLRGLKNEEPEDVFHPMPFGYTYNPPKDSEGFAIPMGGRSDRMLYQDGSHKKYRPRNLPEGAFALYDMHGNIIKVLESGIGVAHAQSVVFKIGKGQDVSSDDGSQEPGPDAKTITFTMNGDAVVMEYQGVKFTAKDGRAEVEAPVVLVKSPDVNLGAMGGKFVKLADGSNATMVKAV